jgi:two-component system response regulator AtoC
MHSIAARTTMGKTAVSDHVFHPAPDHGGDDRALLVRAIEALGGGALVLDAGLRVVAATPAADLVLGAPVRPGIHAVKLLCGGAVDRPVAESLAAGRALVATIPRLGDSEPDRLVRVRARPLRALSGPIGWIVLVSEEPPRPDDRPEELHGLWTRDVTMKRLFRLAERVARCDASVLVRGEMGTGKASLAAAIHRLSPRHDGAFRAVSCALATPATLERHAREADGGTLFLDGVEQLSPGVQGELLRVLESGMVTPSDGGKPAAIDARVIASTHASLQREVESGRFRPDLLYRLRIASLYLPPLRARRGDVALLTEKLVAQLNERGGRRIESVAKEALARLEQHAFPGNVRELRAAIESAFATGEGAVLVTGDLPPEITDPFASGEMVFRPAPPSQPPPAEEPDEVLRIRRAVERAGGDRAQAATMLGMSRTTLWRRMRALGLTGHHGDAPEDEEGA